MPSYVIDEKCDGCKGQDRTACMYICPNDLMVLDAEAMKAYNQEPEFCWECYSCVKICPQQAMDVRGYADFVPMGASVVPLRGSVISTTRTCGLSPHQGASIRCPLDSNLSHPPQCPPTIFSLFGWGGFFRVTVGSGLTPLHR
jgi:NAD-dependent dihydropyrimidine dehydrogenase PreA subunit